MAPNRAFSFPLSHAEEIFRTPPFSVPEQDSELLRSCRAFQVIRAFLKNPHDDGFCRDLQPLTAEHEEAWLLQRDITYALILPLLEIHRYATQLATSVLGDRHIFDLELVFRGEARGAFAWLQCFIAEEEECCMTHGCPACVVAHVLEAEPSMRIVLIACHLAQSLRGASHAPVTLPILDFWSSCLGSALDEDPFWGPTFWKDLESRTSNLENGVRCMVRQCIEFENMGQSGNGAPQIRDSSHVVTPRVGAPASPTRLGAYKADGRRMVFVSEESSRMHTIVLGCWTSLLADAANMGHPEIDTKAQALSKRFDLRAPRSS